MDKKILITGKTSYIGARFQKYMENYNKNHPSEKPYQLTSISLRDKNWKEESFRGYDIIFHVAGLAHSDIKAKRSAEYEKQKALYYEVNYKLTEEVAKKAKKDGVRQFIYMSSIIVYGDFVRIGEKKIIDHRTPVSPENFYGDSKVKAENALFKLEDDSFKVAILRAPMIYGEGCKGNYRTLVKLAERIPVFPDIKNERSMCRIDHLCRFVESVIRGEKRGIFFPQDPSYVRTSKLVASIAKNKNKPLYLTKIFNPLLYMLGNTNGKAGRMVNKAFGSIIYKKEAEKKKVLMLTSVASMIDQFNMDNIRILKELGYQVHVACNFEEGNPCSAEKIKALKKRLKDENIKFFQIDFSRNVLDLQSMVKAYRQTEKIISKNKYAFLHCHSPVGGAIGRICAHKNHIRAIYTAHGFHFYKGAPLKNWLLFYPVEKYLSKYTDVLITINQEDYGRAKKFYAKETVYVPGVGVEVEKYSGGFVDKEKLRKRFGIPEKAFLLLSVGELNKNKNHAVVIRALKRLRKKHIYYLLCGIGKEKENLERLARRAGVAKQVIFAGFQEHMEAIYRIADVFVFPSKREGLGLAALEAMAVGLPLITSNVHGINDYSMDNITGFRCGPCKTEDYVRAILKLADNKNLAVRMGRKNKVLVRRFDKTIISQQMKAIYEKM